ncbi:endo alpha-1,4 polygalactosaminidase [Nocardioides dongxiaopingii]|uniref:endo alpha-1,4 polygalactosaminidase n=1 Tax=Nocardioides sp. S-1144 TaxID=2582905 RepID=UPI00110E5988|nr:endo alpha-1,4 polygalactosaminidase [Nocardioides sp. S-1144]QCW50552.1 endo alpha-1,4 polygalactosaminidase [Nocardioides sp. S-1144]
MHRPLLALTAAVLGLVLGLTALPAHAADVTPLPTGTDVDYQLGGPVDRPAHVGIVVRDRTAAADPDRYNVCYVNGFQTQPDAKRFWRQRWNLVLKQDGRPVVDENWGEWLLDIATPAKRRRLAAIVGRWVDGCARDGFQAVEFDNLDSFTRSRGELSRRDATAFARLLVRRTHAAGLAAGQKNLAGYDGTRIGFDFAVSESCAQYRECGRYVEDFGTQVLMVEYRRVDFRRACADHGATHAIVLRDLALRPGHRARYC